MMRKNIANHYHLPVVIVDKVASFLSDNDVCVYSSTCRALRRIKSNRFTLTDGNLEVTKREHMSHIPNKESVEKLFLKVCEVGRSQSKEAIEIDMNTFPNIQHLYMSNTVRLKPVSRDRRVCIHSLHVCNDHPRLGDPHTSGICLNLTRCLNLKNLQILIIDGCSRMECSVVIGRARNSIQFCRLIDCAVDFASLCQIRNTELQNSHLMLTRPWEGSGCCESINCINCTGVNTAKELKSFIEELSRSSTFRLAIIQGSIVSHLGPNTLERLQPRFLFLYGIETRYLNGDIVISAAPSTSSQTNATNNEILADTCREIGSLCSVLTDLDL